MPFPYPTSGAPPPGQGQPSYFPSFDQVFPWFNPQWTPRVATTGRFGPVPGYGAGRRGLLDQGLDTSPMLPDPRMQQGRQGQDISGGLLSPEMIQRIAQIFKFPGVGGVNPYTEMRDPGAGGGRGLLGSQWRNPEFIQQYETQQGYRPGTMEPPSANVRQFATTTAPETLGRQKWSYEDGAGVKREGYFDQSLDGGKTYAFRRPDGRLDLVSGQRLKNAQNITTMSPEGPVRSALRENAPTTAQMARPVRMTPEIAAKLQGARDARAQSAGMQLVRDVQAWQQGPGKGKLPFDSKVLSDRFNKLDVDQREIFNRIMFPWDYNK